MACLPQRLAAACRGAGRHWAVPSSLRCAATGLQATASGRIAAERLATGRCPGSGRRLAPTTACRRGLATSTPEMSALRNKVAEQRLRVAQGCLTDVEGVDAVVNCANEHMVGAQLPYINLDGSGGCVFDCTDRTVHKRAGPKLYEACQALPVLEESNDPRWGGIRCRTGEACITPAFELPHCRSIVHVVSPTWPGDGEELRAAYQACINVAIAARDSPEGVLITSLAVPALSGGIHQWPRDMSWAAAVEVFGEHLLAAELARGPDGSAAVAEQSLQAVVLAAWDAGSREEAEECVRRWVGGTLTEDGLL